jgi:hypothetical protein
MVDVDAIRPAPAEPTSGRRSWARHRTPLIVLITASTLLMGSVAAVAATSIASARQRAAQAATVTADQSRLMAHKWLDANRSGQSAQAPDSYPGYYTMETMTSGKITGMLSVNATTGAVWYHSWHGRFIARED